jgi:hypothetical protein
LFIAWHAELLEAQRATLSITPETDVDWQPSGNSIGGSAHDGGGRQ